jgi:hypothetical protein
VHAVDVYSGVGQRNVAPMHVWACLPWRHAREKEGGAKHINDTYVRVDRLIDCTDRSAHLMSNTNSNMARMEALPADVEY